MKSSRWLSAVIVLSAVSSYAAGVDMQDPKRALGREDNVRVDAQILSDSVAANSAIHVVYQIENLTSHFIAVADRICNSSYDSESRTIVIEIGAEIPINTWMPHLATIAPGEKRAFNAGTTARVLLPDARNPFTRVPRYLQIKVNILRDTAAFTPLIAAQTRTQAPIPLADELFDKWLDANDSIYLNSIPVQWGGQARAAIAGADQRGPGGL